MSKADSGATARPWALEGDWVSGMHHHRRAIVATCSDDGAVLPHAQKANAALIVEAVNSYDAAQARIRELEETLRFYRDEWRLNGDGDSETPGLSRSWMEPTDALVNDEGRKAFAALTSSARPIQQEKSK